MSSTNSTCSILAYFVPYVNKKLNDSCKFFEECDTLRDNWKTEMEYLQRVCIPEVANQIWILSCRSPQKLIYKRYLEWISPHRLFRGFLNIFKTIFIRTVSGASIEPLNDENFKLTETQKSVSNISSFRKCRFSSYTLQKLYLKCKKKTILLQIFSCELWK